MGIVVARIALHRVAGALQGFSIIAELAVELLRFEPGDGRLVAAQTMGGQKRLLGLPPQQRAWPYCATERLQQLPCLLPAHWRC